MATVVLCTHLVDPAERADEETERERSGLENPFASGLAAVHLQQVEDDLSCGDGVLKPFIACLSPNLDIVML